MRRLVAIVGPTAAGKSRLALGLAISMGGEIINADSRQVYRHMDIGTAKPGPQERSLVPHHLLDVVEPDQDFSLAVYRDLASHAIMDVSARGRLPILAGGTGQYVWAMVEGWELPHVPPDRELRNELQREADEKGPTALHSRLALLDPDGAAAIHPRNVRRVIRALEVTTITGVPFSRLRQRREPPFKRLVLGVAGPRAELYAAIDRRVDAMFDGGLVEEVMQLRSMGFGFDLPPMSGIGYGEVGEYLQGRLCLADAIQRTKYRTHQLARRQHAWFRPDDTRIRWLTGEPEELLALACALATEFVT